MERIPGQHRLLAVALVAALLGVAGCSSDDYTNRERPPLPFYVAGTINDETITVSPPRIGGGPIVLTVVNQSDASQVATIEVDDLATAPRRTKAGLKQSTGPINPGDTAQLKVNLDEDTVYQLRVDDDRIDPASISVGAERPSAQNDVLTP